MKPVERLTIEEKRELLSVTNDLKLLDQFVPIEKKNEQDDADWITALALEVVALRRELEDAKVRIAECKAEEAEAEDKTDYLEGLADGKGESQLEVDPRKTTAEYWRGYIEAAWPTLDGLSLAEVAFYEYSRAS